MSLMKRQPHEKVLNEIMVDNFAGGGGTSTGIELAIGRSVDIAINHDPDAIAMHKTNHPETEHFCESVWDVDPKTAVRNRPVAMCWFSPDCKHFSKAKGGTPVEKKIRGLAWIMEKWCGQTHPRVAILENVEEFTTWGPLIAKRDIKTGRVIKNTGYVDAATGKWVYHVAEPGEIVPLNQQMLTPDPKRKGEYFWDFVKSLRRLGYQVEWKMLKACDYGAPTIRKRFFMITRCDGQPIVWPQSTHGNPDSPEVKAGLLKPWRTAAEIIDWSIPCKSIFGRKKPLAENTMRRIAKGIQKYVIDNPNPFIIEVNHDGGFRGQELDKPIKTITSKNGWGLVSPVICRQFGRSVGHSMKDPLGTITTSGGGKSQLVVPFIAQIGQTRFGGDRMQHTLKKPLTTILTKAEHLLVSPTLIQMGYGDSEGRRVLDLDKPLGTVTAGGNKFALVSSHIIKFRGTNIGQPVTEPLQTVTAGGLHFGEVRAFLLKYYGADVGQSCYKPLHTVTTKDRFGLITIHGQDYQIVDIRMRMLKPKELFAAQSFPKDYAIDMDYNGKSYPEAAQVARCGNAVPPVMAEQLTRANLPEMCGSVEPNHLMTCAG